MLYIRHERAWRFSGLRKNIKIFSENLHMKQKRFYMKQILPFVFYHYICYYNDKWTLPQKENTVNRHRSIPPPAPLSSLVFPEQFRI